MSGDGGSGGDGYEVDTSALTSSAKHLTAAAGHWTEAITAASGATMPSGTLGVIGDALKFPETYNQAQAAVVSRAKQGPTSLTTASGLLDQAAAAYESQDSDTGNTMDNMAGMDSHSGGGSGDGSGGGSGGSGSGSSDDN
ncbi:type VII secretion target [Kibdelosporangium lantanae]|uniref:Type VII secretion target n=1 Tax=Kibdelosporangium lantanae TaxID=1497396 RepID=A0ABW3M8J7_9PSEU